MLSYRKSLAPHGRFSLPSGNVADLLTQSEAVESNSIASEGIRFDDIDAGSQIGLMNRADQLRLCQVEVVEAFIDADARAVEHRAHGAVHEENALGQSLKEWMRHDVFLAMAEVEDRPDVAR